VVFKYESDAALYGIYTFLAEFYMLDPSTTAVIARTKQPILQPEENYERIGDVNNVVFPTGACIINEKLHVYYGGADKVCCLAVVELDDLLQYILNEG
jgi:predicted GH43/DUF377 family glycosyl hydrolase